MRDQYGDRGGGFGGPSTAPVKVGDELEITIEAVGEKGDGIAKKDGFVLFVPNTKQGQKVRIRVTKVLRKVGFADVIGDAGGSDDSGAEAPADEAPAEEAPAGEPQGDFSEDFGDEAPADEAPADEAPADEAPADEAPADEAPAGEPAEEAAEEPAEDAAEKKPEE